jgi:N-acetylmuramoyl-L-alanine amidase
VPLITRTNNANKWGANIYLSVHHDAHNPLTIGPNGGTGGGITARIYTKASQKSKDYQKLIYTELIKETGLKGNRSTPMPQ